MSASASECRSTSQFSALCNIYKIRTQYRSYCCLRYSLSLLILSFLFASSSVFVFFFFLYFRSIFFISFLNNNNFFSRSFSYLSNHLRFWFLLVLFSFKITFHSFFPWCHFFSILLSNLSSCFVIGHAPIRIDLQSYIWIHSNVD